MESAAAIALELPGVDAQQAAETGIEPTDPAAAGGQRELRPVAFQDADIGAFGETLLEYVHMRIEPVQVVDAHPLAGSLRDQVDDVRRDRTVHAGRPDQ